MKKLRIAVLLVTVISLLGLILACPSGGGSVTPGPEKGTPVYADYEVDVSGITDYDVGQTIKPVTAEPKDKSKGLPENPSFLYNGKALSTVDNTKAGSYSVTMTVPSNDKWNSASFFLGSFLIIDNSSNPGGPKTPTIDDFNTSLPIMVEYASTIIYPPNANATFTVSGKSPYNPTITAASFKYRRAGSSTEDNSINTSVDQAGAVYDVLISVPAVAASAGNTGWTARDGIKLGTVSIKPYVPPEGVVEVYELTFDDFTFKVGSRAEDVFTGPTTNLPVVYSDGNLPLTVEGKTAEGSAYITAQGLPTRRYWQGGVGDIMIGVPKNAGTYTIEVDFPAYVNVIPGQEQAFSGLKLALPLTVLKRVPNENDFTYTKQKQAEKGSFQGITYSVQEIGIVSKFPGSLDGTIIIRYNGNPSSGTGGSASNIPQTVGNHVVTFSVGASTKVGGVDNWDTAASITVPGGLEVVPLAQVGLDEDFKNGLGNFWIEDDVMSFTISDDYVVPGQTVTFTAPAGSQVLEWRVDGKVVGDTGLTHSFSVYALGWHRVSLAVSYNGKVFSKTVEFRVQQPQ
jgi:hypothetical protein